MSSASVLHGVLWITSGAILNDYLLSLDIINYITNIICHLTSAANQWKWTVGSSYASDVYMRTNLKLYESLLQSKTINK
jgi:hypothetical protein